MLTNLTILTRGGLVLYSYELQPVSGHPHPIDVLVRNVLLEERTAESSFQSGAYTLRWTLRFVDSGPTASVDPGWSQSVAFWFLTASRSTVLFARSAPGWLLLPPHLFSVKNLALT